MCVMQEIEFRERLEHVQKSYKNQLAHGEASKLTAFPKQKLKVLCGTLIT